jgi:hypothetical protein
MVGGPITFDTREITTCSIGMDNSKVNSKTGNSNLRVNIPSFGLERFHDGILEGRLNVMPGRRKGFSHRSAIYV